MRLMNASNPKNVDSDHYQQDHGRQVTDARGQDGPT